MNKSDYEHLRKLVNGFVKYIKIQTYHYKSMTEEERFDMITDIESLFYIYVDMYDDGTPKNDFIEFIGLHKKELFGSAEWQKILKDIYNNYTLEKRG